MRFDTLPKGAPPIYGYEAKWLWDSPSHPLEIFDCPARIPEELAEQVRAAALAAYHALECRDWCRIDIRCDAADRPMVVELNPAAGHFARPARQLLLPQGRAGRRDELRRPHPHRRRHRLAADQRPFTPGGGSLMRVAILYDAGSDEWSPQDVAAVVGNVHEVRDVLRRRGNEVELLPVRLGDFRWLSRVRRADLVFNLCEGINGHARFEDYVVGTLELAGVPFTGLPPLGHHRRPPQARRQHPALGRRPAGPGLHARPGQQDPRRLPAAGHREAVGRGRQRRDRQRGGLHLASGRSRSGSP